MPSACVREIRWKPGPAVAVRGSMLSFGFSSAMRQGDESFVTQET